MENFDSYDFENKLQGDFFYGNIDEIKYAIESKLKGDSVFAEQYEAWISESSYNSWREFYKEMQSQKEAAWDASYPNGDDEVD
ncbi:MAG TPA: hypothetical protein VIK55_13950 [Paludibacter sp.]